MLTERVTVVPVVVTTPQYVKVRAPAEPELPVSPINFHELTKISVPLAAAGATVPLPTPCDALTTTICPTVGEDGKVTTRLEVPVEWMPGAISTQASLLVHWSSKAVADHALAELVDHE